MKNTEKYTNPYSVSPDTLADELGTNLQTGLSEKKAIVQLLKYGSNKITDHTKTSGWMIFLQQFKSPLVALLAVAAGLSLYFNEWPDAIAIAAVIVINTCIGFLMEFRADRSMEALQKLVVMPAKVKRDGRLFEINADKIVPGDILFIEAGDVIPADGRLFGSSQLQTDESALTGESLPVEKNIRLLPGDTILSERKNMLYKATYATGGNGYMIVTSTGMHTELGKIALLMRSAQQMATPLEKKLESFSKKLIWVTLALSVLIFFAGLLNGKTAFEMFQTAVALAVATIPEGLPVVATMALARGMLTMARHNVIVKKLSAVETLGGTNVICTDKTGTLTQNKIEVNEIMPGENREMLLKIAVLCNTAELTINEKTQLEIGDPLETGLLKFALKSGVDIRDFRENHPKISEVPFSSETKLMATLHKSGNSYMVFAKGAAEEIIRCCNGISEKGNVSSFTEEMKISWLKKSEELAANGQRVIAGAFKPVSGPKEEIVSQLVFAGLFCMIDPPREEVYDAIKECKSAGIDIIMITGDHPATAKYIARQLGIISENENNVITGKEMTPSGQLTKDEKEKWVHTKVFARVTPHQKIDLVSVLQEKNLVVGMTGDGVNDAPALKKSDIGIAMGIRGTQVSQEAADMVLKDDSFSSIVVAVKQGRIIYENIRKFVIFLLSCNLSELLIIAVTSSFSLHFQLFPLQILFINLITDVLPALALGMLPGGPSIMQSPPRNSGEAIIQRKNWIAIFYYSFIIASVSIGAVFFSHYTIHATETWNPVLCNNILFFSLIFSQLFHVFNLGDRKSGFFRSEVFTSKYVWASLIISIGILVTIYTIQPVSTVLSVYKMSLTDWIVSISAGVLSVIVIQISKK